MKPRTLRNILIALGLLFLLPIVLYFIQFGGSLSEDNNDWIAFGGLFYGFAIVLLTALNLWIFSRHSEALLSENRLSASKDRALQKSLQMQKSLIELDRLALEYREVSARPNRINWYTLMDRIHSFQDTSLVFYSGETKQLLEKFFQENSDFARDYVDNRMTFDELNADKPHSISWHDIFDSKGITYQEFKEARGKRVAALGALQSMRECMKEEIENQIN